MKYTRVDDTEKRLINMWHKRGMKAHHIADLLERNQGTVLARLGSARLGSGRLGSALGSARLG